MKNNSIIEALDLLRSGDYYGVNDYVEIAKGKHEIVSTFKEAKTKIKRLIKAKR